MTLLVAGISSATIIMMMAMESKAVTPNETFSVFSPLDEYGVKKPMMVTTVMNAEGIINLQPSGGFIEQPF